MNEQLLNLKFVEEVEKRPLLYNYNLPEYTRRDLTEQAWNEVGKITNLKGSECKEKWRNLRVVFGRTMKNAQSCKGPKKKRKYYLSDAMQFTIPFIRTLITTTSEQKVSKDNQNQNYPKKEKEDSQGQVPSASTPPPNKNDEQPPQLLVLRPKKNIAPKRKRAVDDVDSCFIKYFNAKKAKLASSSLSDKDEAKKMFLLSMLPELNEMNDQQIKKFKRQVLDLIDDIKLTTTSPKEEPLERKVFDNPDEHVIISD